MFFIKNIQRKETKMNDPYCYENCEVLRNKLGIRNDEELSKAEVEFSCNAIHELGTTPLEGDYDFAHLCAIHNRMFRDIYEWAGKTRTVDMEKAEAKNSMEKDK